MNSQNVQDLQAIWECIRTHASGLVASALTVIGAATVVFRLLAAEVTGIKTEGLLGRAAHWLSVLGLNKK
jgi:hypothetical protein